MTMLRRLLFFLLAAGLCGFAHGRTLYVNGSSGLDTRDGLSSGTAKKTIQAAVDIAQDGDVVSVACGTYGSVKATNAVAIVSTDGSDATVIELTSGSCAVALADGASISGFTLRGEVLGVALYGGAATNCVITGFEDTDPIVMDSDLTHCLIVRNRTSCSVVLSCVLTLCTVANNESLEGEDGCYGLWYCSTDRCVVYDNGHELASKTTPSDPRFVRPEAGDWRLRTGSPSAGCGYWPDPVDCLVVSCGVSGRGTVSPAYRIVASGETATFTATASDRPFVGWTEDGGATFLSRGTTLSLVNVTEDRAVTAVFQTNLYVNAASTAANPTGLSEASAFSTLQAAADAAYDGETIFVAPGTYDAVSAGETALRFVATGGPDVTFISGKNSNRCAYLADDASLEGFTLIKGYARYDKKNSLELSGLGGGVSGGTLTHCVISNCYAYYYGGAASDSVLVDCLVVNNRTGRHFHATDNCRHIGCTVVGNGTDPDDETDNYFWTDEHPNNIFGFDNPSASDFADPARGDWRLRAGSKFVDAGSNGAVRTATDLAGLARIQNGRVDRGCYEGTVAGARIEVAVVGTGCVTPVYAFAPDESPVTFTATVTARPFLGWSFDGTNIVATATALTLPSETFKLDPSGSYTLTAHFQTELFVDGATGNDANDGLSAAKPLKTLQAAADAAYEGETIRVGPGTYDAVRRDGKTGYCRFVATAGPERTVIVSGADGGCASGVDLEGFTLRTSAPTGDATAAGAFVLDARTVDRCIVTNCSLRAGMRIFGSCTVRNSLVSGNVATNILFYQTTFVNCTVVGNRCHTGSAAAYTRAYNTIFFDNRKDDSSSGTATATWSALAGSVFSDPGLVLPEGRDWRQKPTSLSLDAGDDSLVEGETDLLGRPRIQGAHVDQGCYEGSVNVFSVRARVIGPGACGPAGQAVASNGTAVVTADNSSGRFLGWSLDGTNILAMTEAWTNANITADLAPVAHFSTDLYVDGSSGDDGEAHPYVAARPLRTIGRALELAIPGDTVNVAPGTYGPVVVTRTNDVRLVGTGGYAVTTIDGGGTNRCVTSKLFPAVIEGFTLANGSNANDYSDSCGGGVLGPASRETPLKVVNCHLKDCTSRWRGGGCAYATAVGCLVTGCQALCADAYYSSERADGFGDFGYCGDFYGCTLIPCRAAKYSLLWNCSVYNTLVAGPYVESNDITVTDASSLVCADPGFMDMAGGDYRLTRTSPCVDAGTNDYVTTTVDLGGRPRVRNGTVDIGAFEFAGETRVETQCEISGDVQPAVGVQALSPGTEVTFRATVTDRPFLGWMTNGVAAADLPSEWSVTVGEEDLVVRARFQSELYVNAETGDDAFDGLTPARPFRTIARAVAATHDGETIRVARGVYGPFVCTGKRRILSDEDDPRVTIIDGGGTNRCVVAAENSTNLLLRGFTLRNGYSRYDVEGAAMIGGCLENALVISNRNEKYGSILYAATLRDSLVTRNTGGSGVYAAYRCTLWNCTVAENACSYGSYVSAAYNTVISESVYYSGFAATMDRTTCCWKGPDALFVDAANLDFRLRNDSPCIDAGSTEFVTSDVDFAGRPRLAGAAPDLGCYEGAWGSRAVSRCAGHGSAEPADAFVTTGGSVTFRVSETGRPFLGWTTNGTDICFTEPEVTFDDVRHDLTMTAVFLRELHVDGASGDDANTGFDAAHAKRTIQAAVGASYDDDTIYVAPGAYAGGVSVGSDRRLVILSTGGYRVTMIDGGGTNRCVSFGNYTSSSRLVGFTLANGYAGGSSYGGCLNYGRAEQCVLANGRAYCGGGAYHATLVNCLVTNCVATYSSSASGSGIYSCSHYNCTFYGCGSTAELALGGSSGTNSVVMATADDGRASLLTDTKTSSRNFLGNPGFVSARYGDFRIRRGYIGCDAGLDVSALVPTDLDGGPRLQGGGVNPGAIESEAEGFVVESVPSGPGAVEPDYALLAFGGSATFAARPADRAFLGWSTNGTDIVSTETTFTVSDVRRDVRLTAHFVRDVYVTTGTSLQDAIDAAHDGDTLHVPAGSYGPISLDSRNLTVVADEGPLVTFIDGGGTNRCVTMSGRKGLVRGFTLRNGSGRGAACTGGRLADCWIWCNRSLTTQGGAIYDCTATDCAFWGNYSGYGAGENIVGSTLVRERLDAARYVWAPGGDLRDRGEVVGTVLGVTVSGHGTVEPSHAVVAPGTRVTFRAIASDRAFLGWSPDGTNVVSTAETYEMTAGEDDASVTALFESEIPVAAGGSIQDAIDAAHDGETIRVAPGTYAPFDARGRRLAIVGTEGARRTVVDAQFKGRCAVMDGDCTNVRVEGFTFTSGKIAQASGAGVCGGLLRFCIVSNCTDEGSYSYTYWANGAVAGATLDSCLVLGNLVHGYGGALYDCRAYNCTLVRNLCGTYPSVVHSSEIYNSILYGNYTSSGGSYSGTSSSTLISTWNPSGSVEGGAFDPQFADPASGDWRLGPSSPCRDRGDARYVRTAVDLDGRPRVEGEAVDLGCCEGTAGSSVSRDVIRVAAGESLQDAINGVKGGETILVEPGVYGAVTSVAGRVAFIRSTEGPAKTFIVGDATHRCAKLNSGWELHGFTLRDGHVPDGYGGGANGGTLFGCVVTNCTAKVGGAVAYSSLYDCLLVGNGSTGQGGAAYYGTLYNTTVVRNSAESSGCYVVYRSDVYNSIVYGNSGYSVDRYYALSIVNLLQTEPGFVDYAGGDYRLKAGSVALDGGNSEYVRTDTDLAGDRRIQGDAVAQGAFETPVYLHVPTNRYVDASRADDAGDGLSPDSAKRTLAAAVSAARAGDVIHVAPGVYASASAATDGITVVADEGPSKTFIVASSGSRCFTFVQTGELRGFTLTGADASVCGAGVYMGTAVGCVISNCQTTAACGGGAYLSKLINCLVVDNRCATSGAGAYDGTAVNCTFFGNRHTNASAANNSVVEDAICRNCLVDVDPGFVDPSSGDYRLAADATCFDAGDALVVTEPTDLLGNPRIQGAAPDLGCYEGSPGLAVAVNVVGNGCVEPSAAFVAPGGTATFTVPEGRAFLGWSWTTNGTTVTSSERTISVPNVRHSLTLTAHFVPELFVNASTGDDANDGGAPERAKRTIQAAIDASSDGDTIRVARGVYGCIAAAGRRLSIVSDEGAEVTVIDGAQTGLCVDFGGVKTEDLVLIGFTVRNGSRYSTTSKTYCYGGGVSGGTVVRCILRGNLANYGGGAAYSRLFDTLVVGNTAYTTYYIDGYGGGIHACEATGCTIVGNYGVSVARQANYSTLANCIAYPGSLSDCTCFGVVTNTPTFIASQYGDYRLAYNSPAVDAGLNDFVSTATDLAGLARVQGPRVDAGCYEGGVSGTVVVVCSADGTGSVSPVYGIFDGPIDRTFTATASTRPFLGWSTNGVEVAGGGTTFTWRGMVATDRLTAHFQKDLFVDATNGNNAASGLTRATAKRTIQSAIAAAYEGETIHVAPGTYEPIDASAKSLSIVSDAGWRSTVIDGGGTNRCATLGYGTVSSRLTGFHLINGSISSYGCGTYGGTVRACFYESCANSKADGGGAYSGSVSDSVFWKCTASYGGASYNASLYNCTLVDNKAGNYGRFAYGGSLRNCICCANGGSTTGFFYDSTVTNVICETTLAGEVRFSDPYNGDFRLLKGSCALEAGDDNLVASETDLDGHARIQGDRVDCGAFEGWTDGFWSRSTVTGSGTVTPVLEKHFAGDDITFAVTSEPRHFLGFYTNGVLVTSARTVTFTNVTEELSVEGRFSTHLYADALHGDDANDGLTAETAKRSLSSALAKAAAGETVHAAPGTYGAISSYGKTVTVVADEGPFVTFIDGDGTNRCATLKTTYADGTVLEGFTLTHGNRGVYGGTLSRCIVSNCTTSSGCIVSYSTLQNCLVCNNAVTSGNAVDANYVTGYNSTIILSAGPNHYVSYYSSLYNCVTVGPAQNYTTRSTASLVSSERESYLNDEGVPYANGSSYIVGGGSLDYVRGDLDLEGRPRTTDGKVNRGCFERTAELFEPRVTVLGAGKVTFSPTRVGRGASITYTATETTRPFLGYRLGSVLASTNRVWTWTSYSHTTPVTAVFDTNLYVNAAMPDDLGSGLKPDLAKRTIAAALALACTGDCIRVAAGTYAPFVAPDLPISIVAEGDLDATVLDGGGTNRCATLAKNVTLRGFTVANGRADCGGGVTGGTVTLCVLSNCVATTAGGAAHASALVNCLVARNRSEGDGGGAADSALWNCTLAANEAVGAGGGISSCVATNTLVYGNAAATDAEAHDSSLVASLTADPSFVDAAGGDWHLIANSLAHYGGVPAAVRTSVDLDDAVRVTGGQVDIGCYQGSVPVAYLTLLTDGPGRVASDRAWVRYGGSFTVTATETGRTFLGFSRDGNETIVKADPTFVVSDVWDDTTVVVHFDRNAYLAAGDSIQAAIASAWDGDTLHLAAGAYAPFDCAGRRLTFAGAGVGMTVIDGGGTNRCATLGSSADDLQSVLRDVTLVNGAADYGGGAFGGTLERCVISNCTATAEGGGTYGGDLTRGLVVHCAAGTSGGGVSRTTLHHVTVAACTAPVGSAADTAAAFESILAGTAEGGRAEETFVGSEEDVCFVAPERDDWRLAHISPCIGKGYYDGSVQVTLLGVRTVGHGLAAVDRRYASAVSSATFTATETVRPFLGWSQDGTNLISTSPTFTLNLQPSTFNLQPSTYALTAHFQTKLYLNAQSGDDGFDGFSSATAKRTTAAMADFVLDGETVSVAPGTYAPFALDETNVAFVATGGYSNTVVTGGVATPDQSVFFGGFAFGPGAITGGAFAQSTFVETAITNAALTDCSVYGAATNCAVVRSIVWHDDCRTTPDSQLSTIDSYFADPIYIDPENGDLSVMDYSPCVTGGVVWCGAVKEALPRPSPPVITPSNGTTFVGSTVVSITSDSPKARIWYTTTGRSPRLTDDFLYKGSFSVTTTVTVKAILKVGRIQSASASATLTLEVPCADSTLRFGGFAFEPDGDADWTLVTEDGAPALRSGRIAANGVSSLTFVTNVPGVVSFAWKCDTEEDPTGACTWDNLAVYVDGAAVPVATIDGATDWQTVKVRLSGKGDHTVLWQYAKDGYDDPDFVTEDAGWLRSFAWTAGDPIPDLGAAPTLVQITEALAGSTDARLLSHITDATAYNGYRAWAVRLQDERGIGMETVRNHPRAWYSYALGQDALLAREFVEGDLSVKSLAVSATAGVTLTLALDDVLIGDGATEENLKKVFGLTATTALGTRAFSSADLTLESAAPQDGRAVFVVKPVGSPKSFFLKAEVQP